MYSNKLESNKIPIYLKNNSRSRMPALEGEGLSYAQFTIGPCGMNSPHHHPRATEGIYILQGSNVTTGFAEENSGRVIINQGLRAGQVTFVPKSLIHYQQNMGCDTAVLLSVLDHEDPGLISTGNQMFELPTEAVAQAFNRVDSFVTGMRASWPDKISNGRFNAECAARCRLRF